MRPSKRLSRKSKRSLKLSEYNDTVITGFKDKRKKEIPAMSEFSDHMIRIKAKYQIPDGCIRSVIQPSIKNFYRIVKLSKIENFYKQRKRLVAKYYRRMRKRKILRN